MPLSYVVFPNLKCRDLTQDEFVERLRNKMGTYGNILEQGNEIKITIKAMMSTSIFLLRFIKDPDSPIIRIIEISRSVGFLHNSFMQKAEEELDLFMKEHFGAQKTS